MRLDINDILTLVGMVMIFAGLWWVYPPAALVVIGAVLFLAGTRPPEKAVK